MELQIKVRLDQNEKLVSKFSPELFTLIRKAREIAIECGYNYISTVHFFIADCEINGPGSLYELFYKDPLSLIQFKNSYVNASEAGKGRTQEEMFLEDETENSLNNAEIERISYKQSLIYPWHFFISALTQRFTETKFYKSVKQNPDIVQLVKEYYKKRGVFNQTPMTWEERNIYFMGPGLNENLLATGNSADIFELKSATDNLSHHLGIDIDALYTLKHHFDLLLLNNIVAKSSTQRPDITIISDKDFWSKAINGILYPGQIVQLLDFKLFEWMAASPGITYSNYHKDYDEEIKKRFQEQLGAKPRDLRKIVTYENEGEEDRFISAGTKAIRLAPKIIHNELQHIITATSEKSPISGIPVTMNASYYSELIGLMKSGEEAYVNIIGRLMVLPSELSAIRIKFERTVPKFFIEVFELQKLPMSKRPGTLIGPDVTLSVTYAKRDENSGSVTFHRISDGFKNNPGEVQKTIDRLREKAAQQSGETDPIIIGDFDEFFDHFENVEFPIRDMANGRFSMTKLLLYKSIFGIKISELYMGDKNVINNSIVGAVGSHSVVSNNTFSQINSTPLSDPDYDLLKEELAKLRGELIMQAKTPEEFKAVGLVASAEIAANEKDQNKVLSFLKESGKWVFDTATKIGVNIVSDILKKQI